MPSSRPPNEAVLLSLPEDARFWVLTRYSAGLTQREVATACGITTTWLWMIETGRGVPSDDLAKRLLAVYGTVR